MSAEKEAGKEPVQQNPSEQNEINPTHSPAEQSSSEPDPIIASESNRCGFAAFIGRPNAGKSTLLNQLIGEKIAAVSDKPQTTRTQIQGILTVPEGQIIFVDTPGVHKPGYKLNKRMMQAVLEAIQNVDLLMLIRDVTAKMGQGERFVLDLVKEAKRPTFLLLNKIDALTDRRTLLPLIDQYRQEYDFKEIIPISARTGESTDRLVKTLLQYLPLGPNHFPDDEITDRATRAIVAEMVREKVLTTTEQELPFATAVVVEKWEEEAKLTRIFCAIYVERDSQRAIIIGRGGQKLKQVGMQARHDIEHLLGKKVYLELFVKVQQNWRNDERILDELGIEEKRR